MEEQKNKQELELGKKVEAPVHYSPNSLRRVERGTERNPQLEKYSGCKQVPFFGLDIWNCYEFSFLNSEGTPENYILKIVYSSLSKYIVESKSLKLYLGSFAMNCSSSIYSIIELIHDDLSTLLETNVEVTASRVWESMREVRNTNSKVPIEYLCLDCYSVKTNVYKHRPEVLVPDGETSPKPTEIKVYTTLLRSNCKVTHQPDYGTLFIKMTGNSLPTKESLLKYIISFRGENHFHEEIVETIFMDLDRIFKPSHLEVFAKYTRRGGIDINPYRSKSIADLRSSELLENDVFKPGQGRTIMQ